MLLSGIIIGTDNFTNKKFRPNSFFVASKIQSLGTNHPEIIEKLFKNLSSKSLENLGNILSRIKFDPVLNISVVPLGFDIDPQESFFWHKKIIQYTEKNDFSIIFGRNSQETFAQVFSPEKIPENIFDSFFRAEDPVKINFSTEENFVETVNSKPESKDFEEKIIAAIVKIQNQKLFPEEKPRNFSPVEPEPLKKSEININSDMRTQNELEKNIPFALEES